MCMMKKIYKYVRGERLAIVRDDGYTMSVFVSARYRDQEGAPCYTVRRVWPRNAHDRLPLDVPEKVLEPLC